MQHLNPIDKNLVLAGDEVLTALTGLCRALDIPQDNWHIVIRFRDALYTAKEDMRAQEELHRLDLASPTAAPTSGD